MFKSDTKKAVRAKKYLGQHFLNDEQIAADIVEALTSVINTSYVLEIGPGMGVLTNKLITHSGFETHAVDIDKESIAWLKENMQEMQDRIIEGDFLQLNLQELFHKPFSIIGNFPYNISSQIVFKILENKDIIPLMVGMFQKEVGERICASPGNKSYGILSVLTQFYYHTTYLFTVSENVFTPPPKVKSGVIRLTRKSNDFDIDEKLFFRTVKIAFNQRRKKLRNALSSFGIPDEDLKESGYMDKRAEELNVEDYVLLTKLVIKHGKSNNG